jgi:hypothetical protein
MQLLSLASIKKRPAEAVLLGMLSESHTDSINAGQRVMREASSYGLKLRDYLTLAIETRGTTLSDCTGYEAALVQLNLPVKNDFKEGVVLEAASETFATFPGTRALFPPVIDDMLYFTRRIDQVEQLAPMLAGSRTISGAELLYVVVNDDGSEYVSFVVPELGRIPVRAIRTSEMSVRMYKHGSGIKTSYEFNRRARLDLLTPFAARVDRELQLSKIALCTTQLINGDGQANTACPVVTQSSFSPQVTNVTATPGMIEYQHLLAWLVSRARAGTPIDTVVGNWGAWFQWMRLFLPIQNINGKSAVEALQGAGVSVQLPQNFPANIRFCLSSAMPDNKLLGMIAAETIEELVEAGSEISEEDRAVQNQAITYYRTENSGFRLIWKDTRSIFDYGN